MRMGRVTELKPICSRAKRAVDKHMCRAEVPFVLFCSLRAIVVVRVLIEEK